MWLTGTIDTAWLHSATMWVFVNTTEDPPT